MLGFPLPYRDELLYSVIARHGVHSGIVSPKELLQEVFGDTKVIATSDLPGHLKQIAALYPHAIGRTSIELLYNHTLFPLYVPFIGERRRKQLVYELTENIRNSAHVTAGVAASRIKQPEYLRYCPGCMQAQYSRYGECYWQRVWQVAGTNDCAVHGVLQSSPIRRHDMHRHQYQAACFKICPVTEQQAGCWQGRLIASSIEALLNCSLVPVPELVQWGRWYQQLAIEQGFCRGKQIQHELVRDKVVGFWSLEWLASLDLLPQSRESCWLKSIFRKHRKAFSYLQHLIVLHAFLDPGWCFTEVMQQVVSSKHSAKVTPSQLAVSDNTQLDKYRNRWLSAVRRYGTKQARENGFGDVYAWLYRHDRHWLIEINHQHSVKPDKHQTRLDWRRRDSDTVRELIQLRDATEQKLLLPRRSMNWYLAQLQHKATIEKNLKHLPLCRLFFDRYCENIEQYQIRRITRTAIRLAIADETAKRWQMLRLSGLSEDRLTEWARMFLKEVIGI